MILTWKLGYSVPFFTKTYNVLFPILRKTSRQHAITLSLFWFKCGQDLCCKVPEVGLRHLTFHSPSQDVDLLKESDTAAILILKLLCFKKKDHRDHLIWDYIKSPTWKVSEHIWISKLKTGRDKALAITAVLESAHNQECLGLHTLHELCTLMHMYYSTVLNYMVAFFSSHNMYFP